MDTRADFPLEYLPDEVFEQSYAACPPQKRAALKTALAFYHFYFGEQNLHHQEYVNPRLGFTFTHHINPSPWALFVLEEDFAAPARLLAAAAPAIFAHVPRMFFVTAPAKTPSMPHASCLAALEIAGLGENACLVEDIPGFLQHLCQTPGGRLLLFPSHKRSPFWDTLRSQARGLLPSGLQIYQDIPPRVYLGQEADEEIFRFAQPDARIDSTPGYYQAFYGQKAPQNIQAAASFGPLLEACFTHPKLLLSFFAQTLLETFFQPDTEN